MFRNIFKPPRDEYSVTGLAYAGLIPAEMDVLQHLYNSFFLMKAKLMIYEDHQLLHKYGEDKWTVKETLVHLIDDERIYAYRALCFARNETKILPGFDQDDYARYSDANQRTIYSILEEFEAVRMATLQLFNNLPEQALYRKGYADHSRISVRALAYHIAAHELHHLKILKDKYLLDLHGNENTS